MAGILEESHSGLVFGYVEFADDSVSNFLEKQVENGFCDDHSSIAMTVGTTLFCKTKKNERMIVLGTLTGA